MSSIISRQLKIKYSRDLQVWVHKYKTTATRWHAHAGCHINCYIKLLLQNFSTAQCKNPITTQTKIHLISKQEKANYNTNTIGYTSKRRLRIEAGNVPQLAHWFRLFRKAIFFVRLFVLIIFYPVWWNEHICQLCEILPVLSEAFCLIN